MGAAHFPNAEIRGIVLEIEKPAKDNHTGSMTTLPFEFKIRKADQMPLS
jgi:hypothetical protein